MDEPPKVYQISIPRIERNQSTGTDLVPIEDPEERISALYDDWYVLRSLRIDTQQEEAEFDNIVLPSVDGAQKDLQQLVAGEPSAALVQTTDAAIVQAEAKAGFAEQYGELDQIVGEIKAEMGRAIQSYIASSEFSVEMYMQIFHGAERGIVSIPGLKPMDKMALYYLFNNDVPSFNLLPEYSGFRTLMYNLSKQIPLIFERMRSVDDIWPHHFERYFPDVGSVSDNNFKTFGIPVLLSDPEVVGIDVNRPARTSDKRRRHYISLEEPYQFCVVETYDEETPRLFSGSHAFSGKPQDVLTNDEIVAINQRFITTFVDKEIINRFEVKRISESEARGL